MSKLKTKKHSAEKTRKTVADPLTQSHASIRRREVLMIAAVLAHLPALNRTAENAEPFPYSSVASSDAMQELIERLVRQRAPENAWNAVHRVIGKTDPSGYGYLGWTDAFRDASFQCGVEYAVRSLPSWWPLLRLISPDTLEHLGVFVRRIAQNGLDDVPEVSGGAR